jgi:hypothetical protein
VRTLEEEIDKFFAQKKTSETVEKVIELLNAKTCELEVLALKASKSTKHYF